MAAFLTWLNQWQTGIHWADDDHREIAGLLNRLVDLNGRALAPSRDPRAAGHNVLAALDAVIERTRRHFQAEEAFLRDIRFPRYEGHRNEHIMQFAEIIDLRRTLDQDGACPLSPETLEGFKRWFFNHVVIEDRDYADYYQAMPDLPTAARRPAYLAAGWSLTAPFHDPTR